MVLADDEPALKLRYHPDYLQSLLDYQDLTGTLPIPMDVPELINQELLEELHYYRWIVAYRYAALRKEGVV
jgi:hypothetical protein